MEITCMICDEPVDVYDAVRHCHATKDECIDALKTVRTQMRWSLRRNISDLDGLAFAVWLRYGDPRSSDDLVSKDSRP